jgi:hypothetical protein
MVAQLKTLYLGVSRKLLQLKTSDVLWCLSDPGWILAIVGCLLEPWASGCTLFVHRLTQFDPKVIVQVRRPTSQHQNLPEENPRSQALMNNILFSQEVHVHNIALVYNPYSVES